MTISEFLLARINDAYFWLENSDGDPTDLALKAYLEWAREVVEWHKNWPVLVETKPEYSVVEDYDAISGFINGHIHQMTRQIHWMIEDEYRKKFGSEPPTAPLLSKLANKYSDHPDFNPDWRI